MHSSLISPSGHRISRRQFARAAGLFASGVMTSSCQSGEESAVSRQGVLTARPSAAAISHPAGLHVLGLGGSRDAVLQVPANTGNKPTPLIVLLHGAGGSGQGILEYLGPAAEGVGAAILAPDSRGRSWDALSAKPRDVLDIVTLQRRLSGFGPDVEFLDRALARVFATVAIDPARIVAAGFSDGATYALSLGLINGGLIKRIIAFSPGFVVPGPTRGRPAIFVSHGRGDDILPIDRCSRRIVPDLKARGYDVTYREFDGGHEVPDTIARQALAWARHA